MTGSLLVKDGQSQACNTLLDDMTKEALSNLHIVVRTHWILLHDQWVSTSKSSKNAKSKQRLWNPLGIPWNEEIIWGYHVMYSVSAKTSKIFYIVSLHSILYIIKSSCLMLLACWWRQSRNLEKCRVEQWVFHVSRKWVPWSELGQLIALDPMTFQWPCISFIGFLIGTYRYLPRMKIHGLRPSCPHQQHMFGPPSRRKLWTVTGDRASAATLKLCRQEIIGNHGSCEPHMIHYDPGRKNNWSEFAGTSHIIHHDSISWHFLDKDGSSLQFDPRS